jgi:uncharacterized membrane protein YeaQ/YmgE (transglycosylase-associated protein family)
LVRGVKAKAANLRQPKVLSYTDDGTVAGSCDAPSPHIFGRDSTTPSSANRTHTMNFIIWLIIGGLIGWVASMLMKTDAQQGMILNVVVGIVGALLGGWLITPLVGIGTINQSALSIPAMLVSLVGAIILLAIVNLVRRGRPR